MTARPSLRHDDLALAGHISVLFDPDWEGIFGLSLTGNLQTQEKNATIRREHLALRGACSALTPLCFRTGKHGVLSYGYRHLLWPARPWAYQPDTPNRC